MTFVFAVLIAALVVFLPGFVAVRPWLDRTSLAVACAGPVSVLLYVLEGLVLSFAGVTASAPLLVLVALVVAAVSCLAGMLSRRGRGAVVSTAACPVPWAWALYIALGLILFCIVYVRYSAGTATVIQSYDNVFHYGVVRSLTQSGDWSLLHVTRYPVGAGQEYATFLPSESFYPIAWHIVSALVVVLGGFGVPVATNAVNCVFVAMVFPSGVCALFERLFGDERRAVVTGAFVATALGAFPWSLLCSWPLLANLSSLCMVPCVLALFLRLTSDNIPRRERVVCLALFVVCSGALAAAQPNSIFSCMVFLIPYCVSCIVSRLEVRRKRSGLWAKAVRWALVAFVAASAWVALACLPPLQGVVQYYWEPISSIWQACVDFVLMAYPNQPAQLVCAALVIVGAVRLVCERHQRWLIVGYVLSGAVYVVSAGFGDNVVKHVVSGFWYTDPYRTAATSALCALPLLAIGLEYMCGWAATLLARGAGARSSVGIVTCVAALIAVINYLPSYEVRGVIQRETAFGSLENKAFGLTTMSDYATYSTSKQEFLGRVRDIVGNDLVINQPFDGSLYAYSVDDLNVLYRIISGYGGKDEASWSPVIRDSLSEVSANKEVAEAVEGLGAKYVLILERDVEHMGLFYTTFQDEDWTGILGINDSTPGFEVVLAEGDMRLYRIVG